MFYFNYKKTILLFVFCLNITLYKSQTDYILWQDNKPLTWDDFKGKPEKRMAVASTSYDIYLDIDKTNTGYNVIIKAVFFYYSSWKNKNWIDKTVLIHEQKHFDIVELYARKLRKLSKNVKYTSYKDLEEKLYALYDVLDSQMDAYQNLYDDETEGSTNSEKQREWNAKIINEIKALDDYKSINVNL